MEINALQMALLDRLNGILIEQWLNKITGSPPFAAGDRAPGFMLTVVIRARLS
jgi:hypothetical protein